MTAPARRYYPIDAHHLSTHFFDNMPEARPAEHYHWTGLWRAEELISREMIKVCTKDCDVLGGEIGPLRRDSRGHVCDICGVGATTIVVEEFFNRKACAEHESELTTEFRLMLDDRWKAEKRAATLLARRAKARVIRRAARA